MHMAKMLHNDSKNLKPFIRHCCNSMSFLLVMVTYIDTARTQRASDLHPVTYSHHCTSLNFKRSCSDPDCTTTIFFCDST